MRKRDFLEKVDRVRYEQRGINLQLSHQCCAGGVIITLTWQDERLKKHTEHLEIVTPAKMGATRANCLRWLNA